MTTPTGTPIWGRTANAANYGASAGLRDYGNIGAVNANTDVTAAQYKRLGSDAAAGAMTAPICTMTIRYSGGSVYVSNITVPWAPALYEEYAGGSPPSAVYPTITRASNTLTVTLPSSAADEYGVSEYVIPRVVTPFLEGAYWEGPTGNSTFQLTHSGFAASAGYCPVVVY